MFENFAPAPQTIMSVAVMLIAGFLLTRVTKLLKLPNVTGYIVAGILIGPYCFNVIPQGVIDGMSFLADIALAFIAFGTGEFFKLSVLKKNGAKNIIITLFESLVASFVVFIVTYWIMDLGMAFSIVLSSLAAATAPASTMMTIRQTGSKGDFVDTLLQVVALDDVVGLVAFSVAIAIATAVISDSVSAMGILLPVLYNLAMIVLGGLCGLLLKALISKHSTDNRLIIAIAVLFGFCGICAFLDVSPLLGCMVMGTVYMNTTNDDKLFKQLNYFSPPILLLFFVRSGANFQLDALLSTGDSIAGIPLLVIGAVYFFVRIVGKYAGAFIGCQVTKKDKLVRNYLGFALVPQAGVAIGLAALAARTVGGETGAAMETIILASSVMYELIGPALAKMSLYLSKSYTPGQVAEDTNEQSQTDSVTPSDAVTPRIVDDQTNVDKLISKIKTIQQSLPHADDEQASEDAFTEAAEEYYLLNTRKRTKR